MADERDHDPVNHPSHYTAHPSGVETIQVTEHFNFCVGNAIKYLWRADHKNADGGLEDLRKARWYVDREIQRREKQLQDEIEYGKKHPGDIDDPDENEEYRPEPGTWQSGGSVASQSRVRFDVFPYTPPNTWTWKPNPEADA